jgi:hypothetical protein
VPAPNPYFLLFVGRKRLRLFRQIGALPLPSDPAKSAVFAGQGGRWLLLMAPGRT